MRRQSRNRPDSISKIQKQHFARARIKQQESRQNAQVSSIGRTTLSFDGRDSAKQSQSHDYQSVSCVDQLSHRLGLRQSQSSLPDARYAESGDKTSEISISYVDLLKKCLLEKKDWVGLSPTRPLQMKFTPIEEKERIGKRRKLSKADEARNTAMAKNIPSFARLLHQGARPQTGEGLLKGGDWNFQIHISSPRRMSRHQRCSESPIRSMSSDTMLSSFSEAIEADGFALPQGISRWSNMGDEPEPDRVIQDVDGQPNLVQSPNSSVQNIVVEPHETQVWRQSSPKPVLHRFTLDDQVLAEQLANPQMKDMSSESHRSSRFSSMLGHGMPTQRGRFDDGIVDSSPGINSDDRRTNLSVSHKSQAGDSATLPQTQKIPRRLAPSQQQEDGRLLSEAQYHTPRLTSRLSTKPESAFNARAPEMLFGQKIHFLSPNPFDEEMTCSTPDRASQSYTLRNYMASPHIESVNTPKAMSQNSASVCRPNPGFRFPNIWTPPRAIPQVHPYNEGWQSTDLSTSPIISTGLQDYNHARPLATTKVNYSKTAGDSNYFVERDAGLHAPVFNTPFRR